MKLDIVIFALLVANPGTALSIEHRDGDLAPYELRANWASPLRAREIRPSSHQIPRTFSNESTKLLVGGASESKSPLRQSVGITSLPNSKAQSYPNSKLKIDQNENERYGTITKKPEHWPSMQPSDQQVDIAGGDRTLNSRDTKLEARAKGTTPQSRPADSQQRPSTPANSANTSPFGTPRAQAGPSINRGSLTTKRRSDTAGSSGELVRGHLPNEASNLSREGSFENITPTVEGTKLKTSASTKLYRGAGVGVHYVRNNPKEAGLVALSAFGQAASVGALGPLVYGNKGIGMAVAGVGALSNFAAYTGQSAVNVKKWQRTEAKIPKERQGEPLDPLIDATKAFADRSSHLSGVVGKSVMKPLQIAGKQLKKAVPGSMKKVHSEPNLRHSGDDEGSLHRRYQDILAKRTPQSDSWALQRRDLDTISWSEDNPVMIRRSGTPPGKSYKKDSPAKISPPSSASTSTPPSRRNSPMRKTLPAATSSSQSTSSSKQRPLKSQESSLSSSTQRGRSPPRMDVSPESPFMTVARTPFNSPPRSGLRHTTSNLATAIQSGSGVGRTVSAPQASTLNKGRSNSPISEAKVRGRFKISTESRRSTSLPDPAKVVQVEGKRPADSSPKFEPKRTVSPEKIPKGELQSLESVTQNPLASSSQALLKSAIHSPPEATSSGRSFNPPRSPSPPGSPKSPKNLFSQNPSDLGSYWNTWSAKWAARRSGVKNKQAESPPKRADSDELQSPKSAFSDGGYESAPWAPKTPPSSAPSQTRVEAYAELQKAEKERGQKNSPVKQEQSTEQTQQNSPTSRLARMPLLTKMRRPDRRPPPLLPVTPRRLSGTSGSSTSPLSPFGSAEFQSKPIEKPPRKLSSELPRGELPSAYALLQGEPISPIPKPPPL